MEFAVNKTLCTDAHTVIRDFRSADVVGKNFTHLVGQRGDFLPVSIHDFVISLFVGILSCHIDNVFRVQWEFGAGFRSQFPLGSFGNFNLSFN